MRRCAWIIIAVMVLSSGLAGAAAFQPTVLHVEGTQFAGGMGSPYPLDIDVNITGTPARVLFSVFTKERAESITGTTNGYLGWHYVNKIDTCVYYSQPYDFGIGSHSIHWDACDNDGNLVSGGAYSYYLWAFDNVSEKQHVSKHIYGGDNFDYTAEIQEIDEQGLPLFNPLWYTADKRWLIGSDPEDESLLLHTAITLEDGWFWRGDSVLYEDNFDYEYISVSNGNKGSIQKIRFIPDGEAEIVDDWRAEAPYAEFFETNNGQSAGVCSDDVYLFTTDAGIDDNENFQSKFFIYDLDGYMITDIDLSPWWSSHENADSGGGLNGGPVSFTERKGFVFLNSHASCLNQMIDPARYLDTSEYSDLFVWSNGDGDYTGDKNFEETAEHPWMCNDSTVGPYKKSVASDRHLFSVVDANGLGTASFSLFGHDGTGMGQHSFAGDVANEKYGVKIVDGDTPYDGIYCDYQLRTLDYNYKAATGWHYVPDGIGFIGYDCFRGFIPFYPCSVDEENTPVAITLHASHPNPFNPVTSIPFTLADETDISLAVYNVAGEKVATLAAGTFGAGEHSIDWDASEYASGVYFCRLTAGDYADTVKMTLVK